MNKACIVLLCTFIAGCSSLPQKIWSEDTDSLLSRHAYKQALEQAQQSKPKDTKLINKIQSQANLYRRKQLKRVQTLLIQKQWREAEDLLLHLTQTQPWHKQYERVQQQLTQLRSEEALSLAIEQCLAEATLLSIKLQQSNFKQRNESSVFAWWQQNDLYDERQELTEQLINLSTQAIAFEKYELAKKAFEQALYFNGEIKDQNIGQSIHQGLRQNNSATIAERQQRLTRQLKTAIEDENFEQVIKLKSILSNPPFKGSKMAKLLKKADQLLADNARELDQQGDSVYRQGNIQTAIEFWQQAKALVPNLNGLQDKLSRAQKVQQKLNVLRQSQQSTTE